MWSRILAILFDSSIYGFVLMLATVLLGIAAGGALGGLITGWRPSSRLAAIALGTTEIGIGLVAILALVTFGGAYDALLALRETPLARLVRTDTRLMAALCVVTVLPAALLMGATFPLAARLWAAGSTRLGQRLGGIYGANVGGAIVGSLAGGFVLVPIFGAHHGLLVLAAVNVAVGSALLLVTTRRLWPMLPGAAFPHATLWLGGDLLIGSNQPLVLSRSMLESRLADLHARPALAEVGFNHAQDVLSQFRADSATLHAYAGDGPILTDDHPLLEYFLGLDAPAEPADLSGLQGRPNVQD